ncbi:MAG TPA: CvpA family protein [Xanthobacteraceae bacterium]|nr:CvpA family protein [Xanthobacteraceae bacterium]
MPITFLDLILLIVMLVSAMLAMIRGFMREILSIAAWVIGAVAALYFYGRLGPLVKSYVNVSDTVGNVIAAGGIFLVTLLVVSVITVRISDMILDSRVGALDRTLGFLFGLARGLFIVVVAFVFFDWLVPAKSQPTWVQNAKSRLVLQSTGDWLKSLLPDDPENTILKRFKHPQGEEPGAPEAPDTHSSLGAPATTALAAESNGYGRADRDGMRRLIENGL